MPTELIPDIDAEYRQIRQECGLLARDRTTIAVIGPDAAEFLQGQITNDAGGLATGSGCYALLLDRKGHIQADMRVLRRAEDDFLIDTPPATGSLLHRHLDTYRIGRQVEVAEAGFAVVSLLGPGSVEVTGLAPGGEMDFTDATFAGADCLVVVTDAGLDLFCPPESVSAIEDQLLADHAVRVSADAAEIVRVESGRPDPGKEMGAGPMPAEAGVVERAVDFTKGCYIGQEPVARLHYRGRPNRFLRGLRLEGPAVEGDVVRNDERDLGRIGSAVISPANGRIAMAILRKEAAPGDTVTVESAGGESPATVVELPFTGGEDQ